MNAVDREAIVNEILRALEASDVIPHARRVRRKKGAPKVSRTNMLRQRARDEGFALRTDKTGERVRQFSFIPVGTNDVMFVAHGIREAETWLEGFATCKVRKAA